MKIGKVSAIVVVEIECPDCQEPCVNDLGSYLITKDNETATCEYCHEVYKVPSTAFNMPVKRKSTKNKEDLLSWQKFNAK